MLRKIDELGRLVIPADMRIALDLDANSSVKIEMHDQKLILSKAFPACVICSSEKSLSQIGNKYYALTVLKQLSQNDVKVTDTARRVRFFFCYLSLSFWLGVV